MTDPPSVSVILPTRNRPAFLTEAVRSVLAQRLAPLQLIIVDDRGSGEAERVLDSRCDFQGTQVTVIPGPGRGPGAARNVGLEIASGELVAFLDDDDLWLPHKLEMQLHWFTRRPTLGILGTGHLAGPSPARPVNTPPAPGRIRSVSLSALLRANRLVASSVIARRDCLQQLGGFDESLPLAQDWDLWLRVAEKWGVAVLPAPLVFYRRHPEQRSTDFVEMRYWEGEVLRRALARGLPSRWLRGVVRRRLAWSHVRLGRLLAGRGEVGRAREEFKEAMDLFRWNPLAWAGLIRSALARGTPAGVKP